MSDDLAGVALRRSLALQELRRYDEAAAVARDALAGSPDDPRLLDALASALLDGGRPSSGLKVARQLAAIDPGGWRGHQLVGWGLLRSGRPHQAIPHLERAVSIDPTNAGLRTMLVEVYVRNAGGGRAAGALVGAADPHVEVGLRLAPAHPGPCLAASKVALVRRDRAAAEWWAEEALRRDPNHPVAHQLLGIIAKGRGDLRSAGDHFVSAARADVRSESSLHSLRELKAGDQFTGGLAGSRRLARRRLSDEAREVLERDDVLRRARRRPPDPIVALWQRFAAYRRSRRR